MPIRGESTRSRSTRCGRWSWRAGAVSSARRAPLRPPACRSWTQGRLADFSGRARASRTRRRSRPLRLRGTPGRAPWRLPPPPTRGAFDRRGSNGEPHPVAFDRWSAPPGPSSRSRVVHTETIRTPVLPTGGTAGVAGRGDARLRPGGLGRRRAPVLAPRGAGPPVQGRGRVARGRARASAPAVPTRSAGPPRGGARCSTTSTGSTTPPRWTPRPPWPWPTSTGARLRRWRGFSMFRLLHHEAAQSLPIHADRSPRGTHMNGHPPLARLRCRRSRWPP